MLTYCICINCVIINIFYNNEFFFLFVRICTIKCNAGYYTKNGDTVLTYVCKNKNWVKQSSNKEFIEQCLRKPLFLNYFF